MGLGPAAFIVISAVSSLAAAAGAVRESVIYARRRVVAWIPIARRWTRGLPLSWVVATIDLESGGDPMKLGDGGKSVGLMQVNAVAHEKRLTAAGVTRADLFVPEKNVEWGTLFLREAYDGVVRALAGQSPPTEMFTLVRLVYKGYSAARALREWRELVGPLAARWDAALARTRALV